MRVEAKTYNALDYTKVILDDLENCCVTMVDDETLEYTIWDIHSFPAVEVTLKAASIQFDGKTIRIKNAP